MLAAGSVAFLNRNELLVAYHRQRLASEIRDWRAPPPAGQSKDYGNYSGVESELSRLVALRALDRIKLSMRLYTDGALVPLPSLDRLQNGQNPAPVFQHVKGNPRIQPQTVVIWCDPADTVFWKRFAESTLKTDAQYNGEPSDAPESPSRAF